MQLLHQIQSRKHRVYVTLHITSLDLLGLLVYSDFFKKGNEYTSDIKQRVYILRFPAQTTNLEPNLFPEALHNIPEGG